MALPEAAFHVLLALADSDQHGYAILQTVSTRTNGAVKLNIGTLYTTIKRLLEQGWIEELDERPAANDDERRRYYRITAAGRRELLTEAGRLERMLAMARRAGFSPRKA